MGVVVIWMIQKDIALNFSSEWFTGMTKNQITLFYIRKMARIVQSFLILIAIGRSTFYYFFTCSISILSSLIKIDLVHNSDELLQNGMSLKLFSNLLIDILIFHFTELQRRLFFCSSVPISVNSRNGSCWNQKVVIVVCIHTFLYKQREYKQLMQLMLRRLKNQATFEVGTS